MAIEQSMLFTVIPRGISLNSATKPVSVFVSPQLDGAENLGAFPDWLYWTRLLHDTGLELELQCGPNIRSFPIDRTGLQPDLWEQLFKSDTYVRSHTSFDDYSDRRMISFSVRESLSALKSIYQQASVALALPERKRNNRQDDQPSNRDLLGDLVAGLEIHWDGREARALRREVSDLYSLDQSPLLANRTLTYAPDDLDSEGLIKARPDAASLQAVAKPFSVFHHMPTPEYGTGVARPDMAKLIDFHQALTSLNAYPALLRALGLVFDFDLPNDFVPVTPFDAPGTISVRRIVPATEWTIQAQSRPLETAYMKLDLAPDELFFTAPRSVVEQYQGVVLGLLDLDETHFGLAQIDVDGAMHKAIMLAETLRPSGDHNRFPDAVPQVAQHPEVFDPEATLPSLRSGGFSLFADRRALQLLQSIRDAKTFNDALGGNAAPARPFYAEDLVRGYRLDVWDSRTNAWHSLHLRKAKYVVGDVPFVPATEPEEGFVELAVTQAAPGAKDTDKELYLHEAIARWAGWSLSVARPGRHLSRYANAKDAVPRPNEGDRFAENQPETPFHVLAEYELVAGSLPPLRFGVRYRLRARAVDLAGNSLSLDDPLAGTLARIFALPRDPEGFTYLRFEPVPAPLVVIRAEAAVTAPGSAVDRIVIRTFNDDISKDGAAADISDADRHIIPPRAAIEMGERLSSFDDASGKLKSDAATWKLISDRDLGELAKKKIVIKGRPEPVPDDGSNTYPLEPNDRIDQLPYFPDPLSRGAALRNLPGTPSGTIGRAVPDTGAEARVTFELLSDPNPRSGSATLISFGESGNWEQTRGFRLALADPPPGETDARPKWDPIGRVLTVYLPKGHTNVVPLTSWMTAEDLKLMGVWQWLREHIDRLTVDDPQLAQFRPGSDTDRIAHVLQRAVEGGHWMLTPPVLLTLVHAVQQPIGRPEFTAAAVHHEKTAFDPIPLQTAPGRGQADPTELAGITAWRRPDSNEAYLLGALQIHGASTARIDLRATWDDPVDDVAQPKWSTTHRAAPVEELPLPTLDDVYLEAPGAPDPELRLVGYYDSEHDQILFVRAGDNTTWEDYGFDTAAPRHVLNDTKHHVVQYTATASSRYREYFDPGLDAAAFTRTSEAVAVDVPASARPLAPEVVYVVPTFGWERQTATNLKRSVRFGGGLRVFLNRPWFSSGAGELLGVALWSYQNGALDQSARDKFKPFITQWGMDPIWQTGDLGGVPDVYNFPDADDSEYNVSLEEATARQPDGSPGRVSVAGFAPEYDEERKLWYADLTIDLPSETYMPFVRLALVRYQPRALADAKVSRVVLADFAQLTPDRSALVTADPHHPRTIRVVVRGVAPRGPVAVIQDEPDPANLTPRATQIRVRVQQHDDSSDSDLAWTDAAPAVATVTAERDGPLEATSARPADPDFSLWAGTVQFAQKPPARKFRLLIEEFEFISARYTEVENGIGVQPSRLVYAEIFALDEALVNE
ncbi:MAG: hypothetical protein NVS2B17_17880 [Candidatus Velthaea sp.]